MKLFVEQAILGEGITFGEAALGIRVQQDLDLSADPKTNSNKRIVRNARIVALTDLNCAVISKASFQQLIAHTDTKFGSLKEFLKQLPELDQLKSSVVS